MFVVMKIDKASMLEEAIEYLKTLQLQVQMMSTMGTAGLCMPPMMAMQHMQMPPMAHFHHHHLANLFFSIPIDHQAAVAGAHMAPGPGTNDAATAAQAEHEQTPGDHPQVPRTM